MSVERLTTKRAWEEAKNELSNEMGYSHIWTRLNQIENILGDEYDLEHLRGLKKERDEYKELFFAYKHVCGGIDPKRIGELVEADKSGRCVLLPVKPNLKKGAKESRCFILLDNGEICEDNVYNVSIGPDNIGNMNTIYSTFDFGDFESQEVGIRIFWDEESASEAALKGENHD